MIKVKTFRVIWLSGLAALVVVLAYCAILPFGSVIYSGDFLKANFFIGPLAPSERLAGSEGIEARTLVSQPAYFSLFTPRAFDEAELTVEYAGTAPLIEAGVLRDKTVWQYDRQPLWNAALEKLAGDARTIHDGGVMLWQKQPRYDSVAAFIKNPPPINKIATYNYDLKTRFRLVDHAPLTSPRKIEVGARGNYLIQTYSGGEAIAATFSLRDLNQNNDADDITAIIYNENGQAIFTKSFPDDGGALGEVSANRDFSITTGALAPGPYRLEFKANDDIVTTVITTSQSRWSFVNRLWLASLHRSAINLFSDVPQLTAQTIAPASRQTIHYGVGSLQLEKTYQQFSLELSPAERSLQPLGISRDDVIISGDGVFAFSVQDYINPSPLKLNARQLGALDYIIAAYEPSGEAGRRTVHLNLKGAYREDGKYSLLIAAPGLEAASPLEIKAVRIRLSGSSLFDYFKHCFEDL